jgi:cytochrome P450
MHPVVTSGPRADELLHRLLATSEGQADPYPLYRALRTEGAVHRSELDGVWYVTGFAAARRVLLDPCFGKNPRITIRRHGVPEERVRMVERRPLRPSMITTNPPEHARLRGAAKGGFLPARVEAIRSRVAVLVDEHLDRLAASGTADLMAELAGPLPLTVIGELLGVPKEDRSEFRRLFLTMLGADDPHPQPDALKRVEAASIQLDEYVTGLVAARRRSPGDDVLSLLVERHDGGSLDMAELSATVTLLLAAGVFTTANLIGNGLMALVRHRTEMDRLWSDPALVDSAVEEMLRYDTPIQLVTRQVMSDAEVEGARLREGENVVVLLGAANHDPAWFPEPDRFDISRPDNLHLSFAWGSHFCLGARLARLEAQLVFSGLVRRFGRLDLAGEPSRRPGLALRGLESLPLRFDLRS